MCELMDGAKIKRWDTLLWNIVPWYVGEGGRIAPASGKDIEKGLPSLGRLLALLPRLEMIALVGKKAQSAAPGIREMTDVPLIPVHHMSARVFNLWPEKRVETEAVFSEIASRLK